MVRERQLEGWINFYSQNYYINYIDYLWIISTKLMTSKIVFFIPKKILSPAVSALIQPPREGCKMVEAHPLSSLSLPISFLLNRWFSPSLHSCPSTHQSLQPNKLQVSKFSFFNFQFLSRILIYSYTQSKLFLSSNFVMVASSSRIIRLLFWISNLWSLIYYQSSKLWRIFVLFMMNFKSYCHMHLAYYLFSWVNLYHVFRKANKLVQILTAYAFNIDAKLIWLGVSFYYRNFYYIKHFFFVSL